MFRTILFRPNASLAKLVPQSLARSSSTAVAVPEDAPSWVDRPERDLVNFPRLKQLDKPAPVRMVFIPQGWFDMFYNKTGVTGPYTLGFGVITYLCSKEIYVLEHEFWSGLCLFGTWGWAINKYGPGINASFDKELKDYDAALDASRDNAIAQNESTVEQATEVIESAKNHANLFVAKKDNIGLQLEAAYRERLVEVHQQVKKRLDYQLETSNVERQFEQKHMINWIVNNVKSNITAAQEQASLKQCIVDLKALSAKA